MLKFHKNKKIDELEKLTGLSLHKGAIHCGSLSSEKMNVLFNDKKIDKTYGKEKTEIFKQEKPKDEKRILDFFTKFFEPEKKSEDDAVRL